MSFSSSSPRRLAVLVACVLTASSAVSIASPADAATLPPPLTGTVLLPDGSPAAGARVVLQAEVAQEITGGEGTDGVLIGTAVTSESGVWAVIPTWPTAMDFPVFNPDGSIMIDAQATSADGTWAKLFNFDLLEPTRPGLSATVPDLSDSDIVSGSPGGDVTGVVLSFADVTQATPPTPNSLTPVETDYDDTTAYDAADADDGDETGANLGTAPKRTCDKTHHVCYITGDPGPCRSKELVTSWRNMTGDSHTEKRWVPVQPIRTTRYGHEHYTYSNGNTTRISIAYGGAGQNYAGGLEYSTEKSSNSGNDARAGTYFEGYFEQQWVFRKQRQWCVGPDLANPAYSLLRDSGRRRFRAEQWLGGLTREYVTLPLWACHDAYALKVFKEQTPWVARNSVTSWDGYFSLFGVGMRAKTENNSAHKLEISAEDTTKFCPDSSHVVADANRVQEE